MSKFVQPWVAGILAVGTMSVGGMTVAHYSQQSNGKKAEVCVANNDHANNCHTKPNPGNGGDQGKNPPAEHALANLATASDPLVDALTTAKGSIGDAAKKLDPTTAGDAAVKRVQTNLDSLSTALDGHVTAVKALVKQASDALSPSNVAAVRKTFDTALNNEVDRINQDFDGTKSVLTGEFQKVDRVMSKAEKATLDTVTAGQTLVGTSAATAQQQADSAFGAYATAYGTAQSAPGTVATEGDRVVGTAGATGAAATTGAEGVGAGATTGAEGVGGAVTTGAGNVGGAVTTGAGQIGDAVTGAVSGVGTAVTDGATAGQTSVTGAVGGTGTAVTDGAGAVTGAVTNGVGAVTGGAVTVTTSKDGTGGSIGVRIP